MHRYVRKYGRIKNKSGRIGNPPSRLFYKVLNVACASPRPLHASFTIKKVNLQNCVSPPPLTRDVAPKLYGDREKEDKQVTFLVLLFRSGMGPTWVSDDDATRFLAQHNREHNTNSTTPHHSSNFVRPTLHSSVVDPDPDRSGTFS